MPSLRTKASRSTRTETVKARAKTKQDICKRSLTHYIWALRHCGHVEAGESITASTVREIREETGLTVSNLRMCGVVEWETIGERAYGSPAEVEANSKYIVFMFRTSTYTGELNSSAEGKMEWMTLDEMRKGSLAPHMEEYLRVLLEDDIPQAYGISGSGILGVVKGKA